MIPSDAWASPAATFVAPILDQIAWGVAKGHGSFLTLEFGKPSLEVQEHPSRNRRSAHVRGTSGLWIYCCHWRILRAGQQIAWSEDETATIDAAAAFLNVQRLNAISIDPDTAKSEFRFDLSATLETWPYGDDTTEEQWSLAAQGSILRINASSQYDLGSADAALLDDSWLPLVQSRRAGAR